MVHKFTSEIKPSAETMVLESLSSCTRKEGQGKRRRKCEKDRRGEALLPKEKEEKKGGREGNKKGRGRRNKKGRGETKRRARCS
jgi:hypothetical protein